MAAWQAWLTAALSRAKKMPPLKKLLASNAPAKRIDEAEIMAHLESYQKRRNKEG